MGIEEEEGKEQAAKQRDITRENSVIEEDMEEDIDDFD